MKRINTSRQSHAAAHRNCNFRPDGKIAQHVINATILDTEIEQTVSYRLADADMAGTTVGCISLERMQPYYLVASKFANRYYVVICENGQWKCSMANDERVLAMLTAKVVEYRQTAAA